MLTLRSVGIGFSRIELAQVEERVRDQGRDGIT